MAAKTIAPGPVPAGCPLTPRRWQVLRMVCEGRTYQQIGLKLNRSESTIRGTIHDAYRDLNVANSHQAMAVVASSGWIDPVDDEYADERVTAAQRLYLDAFDRYLLAPRLSHEAHLARAEMVHHFVSLHLEARVPVPRRHHHSDPQLDRLVAVVLGRSQLHLNPS